MDNIEITGINIDEEFKKDLEINEENLVGDHKKQKDMMYKWSTRLAKLENEWKKTLINIDLMTKEKHNFYSVNYDKVLSSPEVKIYINGDVDIIKLRNKKRQLETMIDTIKGGISAIKERGRTIQLLIQQMKY
jgi:hypothetical protein